MMGRKWGKYPETLRIRVTAAEGAALRERAAAEGTTLVAIVRRAIARELGAGERRAEGEVGS